MNEGDKIIVKIKDAGIGIDNIELARKPLYTTGDEYERSGMGFTVMETLMDNVRVYSKPKEGTEVVLEKDLGNKG